MFEYTQRFSGRVMGASLLAGLVAPIAHASNVEITAEYRSSDVLNEFHNTTPNSGYCAEFTCSEGIFSIRLPITYERTVLSGLPPIPQRWSIQAPSERTVHVVSDRGDSAALKLQFTHIAQALTNGTIPFSPFENPATGWSAGGGCTYIGGQIYEGGENDAGFVWAIQNPALPTICYPTSSGSEYQQTITPYMRDFSVGYKLILPLPYRMPMGVYRGSTTFTVGENGEFGLGGNVTALSTNSVTFNFTLDVHHEIDVQFPGNANKVILEPEAGWGKWLSTNITPTQLTANLPFRLTASGPFSIKMVCDEDYSDVNYCLIRNRRTNTSAGVNVKFHPPRGLQYEDNPGAEAGPRGLKQNQALSLSTKGLVNNRPGKFVFIANNYWTGKMVANPGDEWAGLITLVFDARL